MSIWRLRACDSEVGMERRTGIGLGVAYGLLYLIAGPDKRDLDSHYLIAQAFLEGRLYIRETIPWLELVPRPGGGWYSPFPPLLSVLLVPAAALGIVIDTNHLAALFGGAAVFLVWELLGGLGVERRARAGLTMAWGLGSQAFWVAAEGGQHLAPQMAAAALLLASLVLGIERRRPVLAGLLLAGAVAMRLPVGLALPLFVYLYRPHARAADGGGPGTRSALPGPWLPFVIALAVPLGLMALYNLERFGSPVEFGYGLIRDVAGRSVLDEPWYQHGIISVAYLPQGLHSMLLRGPEWQEGFPWVYGNLSGTSVLLTMPILWWVFGARGRLALATGLSAVLVLIPDLLHGNPGFAQVGYRYILDALPLLWLLLGLSLRDGIPRPAWAAIVAGVVANVWLTVVYWYQGVAP
jgi:hypothetical protein